MNFNLLKINLLMSIDKIIKINKTLINSKHTFIRILKDLDSIIKHILENNNTHKKIQHGFLNRALRKIELKYLTHRSVRIILKEIIVYILINNFKHYY